MCSTYTCAWLFRVGNGATTQWRHEGGLSQRRGLQEFLTSSQPHRTVKTATTTFWISGSVNATQSWALKTAVLCSWSFWLIYSECLLVMVCAKAPRCRWPPLIFKLHCLDVHFIMPTTVGGRIQGLTTGPVWVILWPIQGNTWCSSNTSKIVNLPPPNDNFRNSERQDWVNS